jgi:hypothetical protein
MMLYRLTGYERPRSAVYNIGGTRWRQSRRCLEMMELFVVLGRTMNYATVTKVSGGIP